VTTPALPSMHGMVSTLGMLSPLRPGLGFGGTLEKACGTDPGIACRVVWDLTHNQAAAVFLTGSITLVLRIAFIIALALAGRWIVHRAISKIADRAAADLAKLDAIARLRGERRAQRAQSLASLLRNAASVLIFGIAGITIAGYLGLNLAPILASAGVIGVAVGFGAQSLVRDFLSGIFMLMEDQYGVGDVINAGPATGTVEAVGLRTTRLRDVNGVVWHIRNGTIDRIGNQSQGWSRAVIDFPVPYRHDLARVRALMTETAGKMWAEDAWHEVILEEPEVWGVESVYSDAIVMRLVAKTMPMRDREVARELRARLKTALDIPADAAGPVIAAPDGTAPDGTAPAALEAGPALEPATAGRPTTAGEPAPHAVPPAPTPPTAPGAPTVNSAAGGALNGGASPAGT
jgi:moderate conductance mechanosensitive channel